MPTPTKTALERKPQAVVMVAVNASSPSGPTDYDFEWFETDTGRATYFDTVTAWSVKDQAKHNDAIMLTAEVIDTATMNLGRVECIGADTVFAHDWKARVIADPNLLVKAGRKAPAPGAKVTKVRPKVKGRAPTAAAAALAPEAPEAPTPKAATVRKNRKVVAPTAAAIESVTAPVATGAKALKARLAAKQQVQHVEPVVKPTEADVLAAVANVLNGADPKVEAAKVKAGAVMPMGWAIPLGRRANGRFAAV